MLNKIIVSLFVLFRTNVRILIDKHTFLFYNAIIQNKCSCLNGGWNMSRQKKLKRKQIRRNRRISLCISILSVSFLLIIFFCNFKVIAEKPATYKYYTEVRVDRGDTLWSIADRFMTEEYTSRRTYVREIQKINNLGCELQYGERILVPYYSEDLK